MNTEDELRGPSSSEANQAMSDAYESVKGIRRRLNRDDRLMEDLDVDSLDAIEILSLLEDALGVELIEDATSRMDEIITYGDFCDVVQEVRISGPTRSR